MDNATATSWATASNGASAIQYMMVGASATAVALSGRGKVWITKDGVVIPSSLQNVHDDLEAVRKIFEGLDESEKARIEELRGASDMTLSKLQRVYKDYLADYHVQIMQCDDMGWLATWNPFNATASEVKKNAESLAEDVRALRKDVVNSTSGLLREDRIQRERQREAEELEFQRERERELQAERTMIPLLPLPVTAISRALQTPPQACLVARPWSQFPAMLARQALTAAS